MANSDDYVECPACADADAVVELGTLGNLQHFRCKACGAQFSRKLAPVDPAVQEHIRRQSFPCRGDSCSD